MRILSMMMVIAHHLVVNSGLIEELSSCDSRLTALMLAFLGAWGKTAINVFVIISGYFMCKMHLTILRYLKLLFEILFYDFTIFFVLYLAGYEILSVSRIKELFFSLIIHVNHGFMPSFMFFYLLVPIYNIIVEKASKLQLGYLIIVLLTLFTFSSSFFGAETMNEPFWYMTIYFVASYIRVYPAEWMLSFNIALTGLIVSFALALLSNPICVYFGLEGGFLLHDSNKIMALMVSVFLFLTFNNIKPFHNSTINFIAEGCFGVFLIHTASDAMRDWLWTDFLNVHTLVHDNIVDATLNAFFYITCIYLCGSIIDFVRRRFVERPFVEKVVSYFENIINPII